ncbi:MULTISPECIES: LysR family transcriptional regulator [Delftia]|uniref:LysR family transcriptional regulator n=2 Tax=Delftia TaxID=80865 RepID=A0A7T2RZ91_DELAC|nr:MULTISPECIES: LysR family transcriptional regulator [Delftia]MBB1651196.1 LysR family transcriptional regulator [Delftia sp. UME58]MBL8357393.1 LysR family transcriptional regulator [Delftia acidovorans]QPS05970.1 LysR family transcriptional regulator [Delftia acidovorans]
MIRELKTLLAVAREGTFSAAGDKIGLTQSAISAQMQRLEAEVGYDLFDRSGRTARLNDRGHQMVVQAEQLIQLYTELCTGTVGPQTSIKFNIGAIASAQSYLLPEALAKFHRQFPDSRTRLVPGLSMDLTNLVDAGELEMAVVIRPPFSLHSDLRWTTLAKEPFRLIVPRNAPDLSWRELLMTMPFVRYDRKSLAGRQVERFLRKEHIPVRDVCEADELDALIRLVALGLGVSLVPQAMRNRRWPAAVRVIDLGEDTFHRDIGLVHRSKRNMSDASRSLAHLITDAYGAAQPDEK